MGLFKRLLCVGLLVMGASVISAANDNDAEIRALMQGWLNAFNSKDIDALISIYSDKIYYANNGNALARSVTDIRNNYAASFKAAPNVTIDFSEELVNTGEKLAHIAGKYRVNIPAEDGTIQHLYGRVLLIFEKQNHEWKMVVDFDNQGSDLSDATF